MQQLIHIHAMSYKGNRLCIRMTFCGKCCVFLFKGSTGAAGPRLFTIHVVDAPIENLPKAHTCFNRIDIPPYQSYQKMYEKLTQAVEETCGFAVE